MKLAIINNGSTIGGVVLVPGYEPPSDATSRALLMQWGNRYSFANVTDIMDAIPGCMIEYGDNFGGTNFGVRRGWLVLPPVDVQCPCAQHPDYYQIIRDLAHAPVDEVEQYDYCDIIGQGFCPSPDWDKDWVEPQASPYVPEGVPPYGGTGTLPPVPWWNAKWARTWRRWKASRSCCATPT